MRAYIHKLIDVGIICISDSKWVSPVYVVPKKVDISVVKDENDKKLAKIVLTKGGSMLTTDASIKL